MAEMYVGTIHGFCLDLLRTEALRFLKCGVLNEVQQVLFVDRHSKQCGLTTSTDLKGDPLKRWVDTGRYIEALNILREARLVEAELVGCSVVEGLREYANLLDERCYFDYSSIMQRAVEALADDDELRARVCGRVRYVICDEYQDVNPIQECIIRLLHKGGAEVCVVGDDDQTIYQWRGSDIDNILTFEKRYSPVEPIRLQENFRSSPGVVETARDFIAQNTERLAKAMIPTEVRAYEPGDIVALSFETPEDEAQYIVDTIRELHGVAISEAAGERGLAWSDFAVLLRSVRRNGAPIIAALRAAGIPTLVIGMNDLFGAPEAEAARAIFLFMAGVEDCGRDSLKASWLSANLGVDAAAVDRAIDERERVRAGMGEKAEARWSAYSLQRQYREFLENVGLREEAVPDGLDGSKRGEVVFYNLGKFSQVISDFEQIHFHSEPKQKYESFASFLQHQAADAYPEGWQDSQYANPDAVRVMTVHQAKGMEWPVVFVPALLRNRFPASKSKGKTVWHLVPAASVLGQERFVGGVEDERRLFYVALTRSQKFLFLTWAPVLGNQLYQKRSEFWEDVLASKYMKRHRQSYAGRRRAPSRSKTGVQNVVLTFSDLKYFFECPYQFKLRILYGFNPPIHEALGYGKSLHDALAEVHKAALEKKPCSEADAERLVATHLHVPFAYPALKDTLAANAKAVIGGYIAKNKADFDKIEFSEQTIELNLGDGVSVVGRVDLVRRKDTGEVTIVDLKTAERSQAEEVTEMQLHIYALGYRELTGRNADYVEIYELEEQKRKPRSVDEDFIEDVRTSVRSAAESLRAGKLDATPTLSACAECDFTGLCSSCRAASGHA